VWAGWSSWSLERRENQSPNRDLTLTPHHRRAAFSQRLHVNDVERFPMLLKILIALVAVVAAFVAFVALQPSEYRIARSATIAAPAPDVFAHVNDFHTWEAWSPWAKLDPNAKATFEGPSAGEGAVFAWAGNSQIAKGA
jgi:hypothetical protein